MRNLENVLKHIVIVYYLIHFILKQNINKHKIEFTPTACLADTKQPKNIQKILSELQSFFRTAYSSFQKPNTTQS